MGQETLPDALLEKIKPKISELKKLYSDEESLDRDRCKILRNIHKSFLDYKWEANSDLSPEEIFESYISEMFKLKKSRLREYVKVAQREDLKDFPISKACMLLVYKPKGLRTFLEKNPVDKINEISCRDLGALIKNKVKSKKGKKRSSAKENTPGNESAENQESDDSTINLLKCCDELLEMLANCEAPLNAEVVSKIDAIYNLKLDLESKPIKKAA